MRTATYLPRLLMAVVTAALSVAATAPPAVAHAELSSSSPAGGATVQELPRKVTLTFTESVRTPAFVAVTGPAGDDLATGDAAVRDAKVTQPVGKSAEAGRYAVSYRITSADGHPISGTVQFTVQGGATGETPAETTPETASDTASNTAPAASADDDSGGGLGTVQLLLLLGALAIGLVGLAVGTRRALKHSVSMVDDPKNKRPRKG